VYNALFQLREEFKCEECVLTLDWLAGPGFSDIKNVSVNILLPKTDKSSKNEQTAQQSKDSETNQETGFNPLYIAIAIGGIGVLVVLYNTMGKKDKAQTETPKITTDEPVVEKSKGVKKEVVKDDNREDEKEIYKDEVLMEFKRPERKPKGNEVVGEDAIQVEELSASAYKITDDLAPINEQPVRMGRGRPSRPAPLYETVQAEEAIQKPPEIIQEKVPRSKPEFQPEKQTEESKHSSESSPVKEMSEKKSLSENKGGETKKVVGSNQIEEAKEFKTLDKENKATWKNTHFIFALDCSETMKGLRWDSTTDGYINCVKRLNGMENVLITALTFDRIRNAFCVEKLPSKAPIEKASIIYTGRTRKYQRALEYIIQSVNKSMFKDYLTCILFISNGPGDYTKDNVQDLLKRKTEGRKIIFYSIAAACSSDEEKDMVQLASDLQGEHYNVPDPENVNSTLLSILNL